MKKIQYILILGLLFIMAGCEKDTLPMNFSPALTTGDASDIFRVGATLSGSIQKSDGVVVKDCGILISELQSMAEYTEMKTSSTENTFEVLAQNLEPGKKYYYCAYASSGYSIARGEIKEFSTTDSNAPVFSELAVENKDEKSFTVASTILDEGGSDLILCGFCWKLAEEDSNEPTVEDKVSNVSAQSSAISTRIKDLTPNKSYLVRAYGINAKGVGYGKTVAVSTNNATVPAVSSIIPVDSTALSVSVKASILSAGESTVTEIGFCWSAESQEPTTANMKYDATDQLGQAEFNTTIADLKPETTYYIRAYAINGQGTGYGDTYTYTTGKATIPGIYTLTDLLAFREAIANGVTDLSAWRDATGVVNLLADIDHAGTGEDWKAIPEFGDVFNGNGHTIKIKKTAVSDAYECWGFFLRNGGRIDNLTVDLQVRYIEENTDGIKHIKHIGAICYYNGGIINNCSSKMDVDCSSTFIGGIAALNEGNVENCTTEGTIVTDIMAAGICADNSGGVIYSCRNKASLTMNNGGDCLGGIVGYNRKGTVRGCVNDGTVVVNEGSGILYGVGGIVARLFNGIVDNCINNGTVTGSSIVASVGGVVGNALGAEGYDTEEDRNNAVREITSNTNDGTIAGPQGVTGGICGILGGPKSTFSGNQNGGTVNGASGDNANTIGDDTRTQ